MSEFRNACNSVKVGGYVAYRPSVERFSVDYWKTGVYDTQVFYPSKELNWRVYKKEDGRIELVSAESVGDLCIGGEIGYAKLGKTLNELCRAYVNPEWADDACSIGYTSESVEEIRTPIMWQDIAKLENPFPYVDTVYKREVDYIRRKKLYHSFERVWLPTRNVHKHKKYISLRAGCLTASGKVSECVLYFKNNTMERLEKACVCGVRPRILLKKGLFLESGLGTKEEPYRFGML